MALVVVRRKGVFVGGGRSNTQRSLNGCMATELNQQVADASHPINLERSIGEILADRFWPRSAVRSFHGKSKLQRQNL